MFPREIGEDSRVEFDSVDAREGEGVRRGLDGGVAATNLAQFRERSDDVE